MNLDFLSGIGEAIDAFVNSPLVRTGIQATGIYIVLLWLAWGRAALQGLPRPQPAWLTPAVLAHVAVLCALWLGRLSPGALPW